MAELTRAQVVELFHIAFLEVFSKRVAPGRFVLKGGVNLRYFFGSVRYSEDIDLDSALAPYLADAANRTLELPYAAFRDQVLAFLEPEAARLYADEDSWVQMQTFVADALGATR